MSSRGKQKKGGKSLGANRMKISKYVLVYKMSQLPLFSSFPPSSSTWPTENMVDLDLHPAPNWDSIEENEDRACDLGYDYDWLASDDSDDGMFLCNLTFLQ